MKALKFSLRRLRLFLSNVSLKPQQGATFCLSLAEAKSSFGILSTVLRGWGDYLLPPTKPSLDVLQNLPKSQAPAPKKTTATMMATSLTEIP